MANTLNDLYLKYVNKVGQTLEKDRYFQYLFAMTQAGQNTLSQTNKILHKVVDEEWISTIEDCIDSLNKVTYNPRRFIATTEEVVPVELAKRISAESVRHLSQHTEYIASAEDGEIHPTKVLNVTTEDSFDLYENRFVYHLIHRLLTFIDKRTDMIFWITGDETMNTLTMESKIDDAYETIEYKLEMKVKNIQSYVQNDNDNMAVFMRIDRLRRMITTLRQSPFCSLLNGCAKVRSPIQRTNLLMKDPDYRNCYKLWQFLETYDSVGYTIEEQDRPLEFDEEYLIQLQTNLITNYTVFKSILDSDKRDLTKEPPKRQRLIKPKFLKKIQEEIVNDYDIEDVEIRKVIIEEVTQAQLDAEAKLVEETKRAEDAEKARDEAEKRAVEAYARMQSAIEQLGLAEQAADQAIKDKESAEASVARMVKATKESIQNAELARIAAEKAAEESESARQDMKVSLDAAENARARAEELMKQAQEEKTAAEQQMISDRIVREQAQASEMSAIKERDIAAEKARAALQKAEEFRLLSEEDRSARAEAINARMIAEKAAEESNSARLAMEKTAREAMSAKAYAEELMKQAQEEKSAAQRQMESDRAVREQAQASELAAIKERDIAAEQAREAIQKAEEFRRLSEEDRTARTEAENARRLADENAAESKRARLQAEEKYNQSEKKARESAKSVHDSEKARKNAEQKIQSAMEVAAKAKKDRQAILAKIKANELEAEEARNAARAALEEKETEKLARIEAEKSIAELKKRLEEETAARIEAEKNAKSSYKWRTRSSSGGTNRRGR